MYKPAYTYFVWHVLTKLEADVLYLVEQTLPTEVRWQLSIHDKKKRESERETQTRPACSICCFANCDELAILLYALKQQAVMLSPTHTHTPAGTHTRAGTPLAKVVLLAQQEQQPKWITLDWARQMCLACKEQGGGRWWRSYSHKANNFHYEHVEANGERRRRAQWATIAMAAAAPVLLLLFSLSMSSSCAVCTPNARQQQQQQQEVR